MSGSRSIAMKANAAHDFFAKRVTRYDEMMKSRAGAPGFEVPFPRIVRDEFMR